MKYKILSLFLLASVACVQPALAYKVEGKANYNKRECTKAPLEFASVAWLEGKTAVMLVEPEVKRAAIKAARFAR